MFIGDSPVVHHCNGDFYSEKGYKSEETPLGTGDTLRFTPNGGRPCDGAFPYYRIAFEGCGLLRNQPLRIVERIIDLTLHHCSWLLREMGQGIAEQGRPGSDAVSATP